MIRCSHDAVHGVWLANTLALATGMTRLTIHRSTNGITWTGPIDATVARSEQLAYDKNWLTCDNGPASPFRGRCYLAYTLLGETPTSRYSAPTTAAGRGRRP